MKIIKLFLINFFIFSYFCVEDKMIEDKDAIINDTEKDKIVDKDLGKDKLKDPGTDQISDFDVEEGEEVSSLCEVIIQPPKKLGEECSDHCECETGYCYDEAYMKPFRFCTRECAGKCANSEGTLTCLNLNYNTFIEKYKITKKWLCVPTCNSVEDCKKLSPKYNYCPGNGKGMTKWDGITIGGRATCQTDEKIGEEK